MSRLITVIFTIPDDFAPAQLGRTDFGIVGSLIKIPPRSFDNTQPSWTVAAPKITSIDGERQGVMGGGVMSEFESWFVDCIELCARERRGPDDYVWILSDQYWCDKFAAGITPRDAVISKFEGH